MSTKIKSALLLMLCFSSLHAQAAYYWSYSSINYSSPESACIAILSTYTDVGYTNIQYDHFGTLTGEGSPDAYGFCYYQRTDKFGNVTIKRHPGQVKRYGEPDPDPVDSCATAPAAIVSRGPYGAVTVADGKKYVLSPSPASVCSKNCLYEKPETSNTKDCFTLTSDPQTGFCNYAFTLVTSESGAGTSCSVNTAVPYETGGSLNPDDSNDDGAGSGGDGGGNNGSDGDDGSGGTGGDGNAGDGGSSGSGGTGQGSGGTGSGFTVPGNADLNYQDEKRQANVYLQMSSYQSTFNQSQFAGAVSSSFDNMSEPAGVCPTPTVELFGEQITFDTHCWLFAQIEPIISMVFMAAWLLVGGLIILSA